MMQQGPLAQMLSDWYAAAGHGLAASQHGGQEQLLALLAAAATSANTSSGHTPGSGSAVLEAVATLRQALRPGGDLDDWAAGAGGGAQQLGVGGDPTSGGSGGGPEQISLVGLLLAALLIGINGAISLWLRLGLHSKLGVGAVRCILQLSLLGYILVPIFTANAWWLTALYSLFMLCVAAVEAVSRPSQSYAGMLPQVLGALGFACSLVISYGLAVVVQVRPWWDAQYLIPMLGMLLGNACSGVAVGLSTILDEFSTGRDRIEQLLALGASRLEASRESVQRAARMALMPLLNQMSVMGIVSIPGMMTGQILGGSDPATAARYQIIIMFLIAAATGISAIAAIFAAVVSVLDECHRLRADRLVPSGGATKGAVAWLGAQVAAGWRATRARAARATARVRIAFGHVGRARRRYFSWRRSPDEGAAPGTADAASSRAGERAGERERLLPSASDGVAAGRLQEVVVGDGASTAAPSSPRQPLLVAAADRLDSPATSPRGQQ